MLILEITFILLGERIAETYFAPYWWEMIKDGRKQNQILSLLPWEFHKDIQSIKKENTKNKRRKKKPER